MPRTFAYVRVSTAGQTTNNQVQEIQAAGFSIEPRRVVAETVSGSVAAIGRGGFARLLDRLEAGDVLVAIADQRTLEQRDIKRVLSDWRVGDVVPIQILRAGKALQRSIQVEAMPSALRAMRRA